MEKKPLIAITGASSGIGKACAELFHKQGYPLLLMARRLEVMEKYNFDNTICRKVDVRDYAAIEAAVNDAQKAFGPVDLMINDAGIMILDTVEKMPLEEQYATIDTNIKGVFNGVKAVLPTMLKKQQGTIINVSSVAGRWTTPTRSIYSASKYAVHSYSEGLRKEIGSQNIRVIIFAPGIVDTNLLDNVTNQKILKEYHEVKDTIDQGLTSAEAAQIIALSYQLPQHVCLKEIVCSHTKQNI